MPAGMVETRLKADASAEAEAGSSMMPTPATGNARVASPVSVRVRFTTLLGAAPGLPAAIELNTNTELPAAIVADIRQRPSRFSITGETARPIRLAERLNNIDSSP